MEEDISNYNFMIRWTPCTLNLSWVLTQDQTSETTVHNLLTKESADVISSRTLPLVSISGLKYVTPLPLVSISGLNYMSPPSLWFLYPV